MQNDKKHFKKLFRNPINLLFLVGIAFSFYRFSVDGENKWTIRSDGSGYYAYLPALFIYNDPTYHASNRAEAEIHNGVVSDNFLFKTKTGRTYNKFFPGEAVMQAPFFLLAHFIASISGAEASGYSEIFQIIFWIGAMFYAFMGLIYYQRFVQGLFLFNQPVNLVFTQFVLATPIFFYIFLTPSFSHVYSFFLFSVFLFQVQKWVSDSSVLRNVKIGLLLGLIFLVRPTNLVILFLLPVLWDSFQTFYDCIRIRVKKPSFFISVIGTFLLIFGILPLSWYWQTGQLFIWSYRGEGFNWMEPNFLRALFSFRSGLILHAPVLILALIGCVLWFRENRFQAIVWMTFSFVNSWIIFSWWCWDYEATFGNRPFTEHFLFLGLPIFYLASKKPKLIALTILPFAIIGVMRLTAYFNGTMSDQRFTSENYLRSLVFWKAENKNRWFFSHACEPYGKLRSKKSLLEIKELTVNSSDEYVATSLIRFPKKRNGERYYVRMTCEKHIPGTKKFKDVFFVVDAYNEGFVNRNYKIMPLYNDIYEGIKDWKKLTFETQVYDYREACTEAKIFIWNPGKHHFKLRNIRVEWFEYGE
jgi:hypothetical protein